MSELKERYYINTLLVKNKSMDNIRITLPSYMIKVIKESSFMLRFRWNLAVYAQLNTLAIFQNFLKEAFGDLLQNYVRQKTRCLLMAPCILGA